MTPQTYVLGILRGDTRRWRFLVWDDQDNTQPANLTGVAVRAEIQQLGAYARHRRVVPLAVTVTANQIDLLLSHDASQQLAVVPSRWDLQLTYPSGDVQTIIAGSVQIRRDVTGAACSAYVA